MRNNTVKPQSSECTYIAYTKRPVNQIKVFFFYFYLLERIRRFIKEGYNNSGRPDKKKKNDAI